MEFPGITTLEATIIVVWAALMALALTSMEWIHKAPRWLALLISILAFVVIPAGIIGCVAYFKK